MENTKIEIPEEFRVIAIRVNKGNKSPWGDQNPKRNTGTLGEYEWPNFGQARPEGEVGLFGCLLSQDLSHIIHFSGCYPYPKYLILEVDARKIKGGQGAQTGLTGNFTLRDRLEIEFAECNVLFTGQLPDFLQRLQRYATFEEYKKISNDLNWKLDEIIESWESPQNREKYLSLVQNRLLRDVAKDALKKGRDMLEQIKNRKLK